MAFIASGQSVIELEVAPKCVTVAVADETSWTFALATELCARLVWRLAQQSCDCIEAQASPEAMIVGELAGELTSLLAAAAVMFSQPSMQPAPAIQRATASASTTRTILVEERNFIVPVQSKPPARLVSSDCQQR